MKQSSVLSARSTAMLIAAVALPVTPLSAQDIRPLPTPAPVAPQAQPTAQVTTTPAPAPRVTPPPVISVAPSTPPDTTAPVEEARAAPRQRAAQRPAPRTQARAERTAPTVPPTPAVPVAAAPIAAPIVAPPATPVAEPAPPPAEPVAAEPAAAPVETQSGSGPWIWLVAGLAVIAVLAGLLAWRRRRVRDEDYFEEEAYRPRTEPVVTEPVPDALATVGPAVPAMAVAAAHVPPEPEAPAFLRREAEERPAMAPVTTAAPAVAAVSESHPEKVSVSRPDCDDIATMVANSDAPSGRPWIELLMRPIRAGVESDEAVVEFELTVGNAGGAPAKDVRVSSWLLAAGSAQDSEMERMLIEAPSDAKLTEQDIAPGDGARIEAAVALPTRGGSVAGVVLPVLVTDARYTLPDGREGRTRASFEIGLARDGGIAAFPIEDDGMHDDIDARLHREPERV